MTMFKVSICICTRNRPDELDRALESISRSTIRVYETIVSDDSMNDETEVMVRSRYPQVKYTRGPRKGLGANRNHAVQLATGTHVLFMDDDVVLNETFLEKMRAYISNRPVAESVKLIVTGTEHHRGGRISTPHEQSFLGFQKIDYQSDQGLRTVVINSTLFPISVFDHILFDDQLVYGYDEVDIATRSSYGGYTIHFLKDAYNFHFPSQINRDYYKPFTEASRLYVTFKRYLYSERKIGKAVLFMILASAHNLAANVKRDARSSIGNTWRTLGLAYGYLINHMLARRRSAYSLQSNINSVKFKEHR